MIDSTQPQALRAATSPVAARTARRRRRAGRATPYLFLAPALVLFIGLIVYPMVRAFQMSFYDWKVLAGATSTFIGLDNYTRAMGDPVFWRGLANSGVYMALSVPPQIVLGLLIAMLLKAKSPSQPVYRVLFYLPVVTSWVVVSLLFKYLFADKGLINWALADVLHLGDGSTSWLSSRWTALIAICALGVWKGIGWSMMIFLAALQGVPKELEEAAVMDGANRWQRFRVVTVPAIRPALVFVVVMLVIGGFNVFTSVLLMTGGGPGGQTEVLLTYMYRQAFTNLDFGYGSAIAVILTVIVFLLSLAQMRLFRSTDEEER
ncbi:carbohydrate ABC transporter permease [Cellulomonas sp. P24]|uniref:carbohydrate ABC transporter permease n=1 Tax=Cellulomonas sp. P24 TaxID=2885206 RepID=UPI00216AE97A|nr:sugar ABC transporter permease [Cellulomonas sp. P24]MCR6492919.1 sugar ABC transporter permease [Cellulomonas sp. P24]